MGSVTITDNTDEIRRMFEAKCDVALEMIGIQCEGHAFDICPVDTGRLRNSLTHAVESGEKSVYIGTNVEYAPYVEFGTRRQDPQPYLKPAVMNHVNEYKAILDQVMKS